MNEGWNDWSVSDFQNTSGFRMFEEEEQENENLLNVMVYQPA